METATDKRPEIDLLNLINPTAKQNEFLHAILNPLYKYLGYGGSKGGGKSYLLRWGMIYLLSYWFTIKRMSNIKVGIFCEDYNSLKDRQISKISEEFPKWLGHIAETKVDGLAFHVDKDYGGGKILLRNLDEPGKYDGVELAAVGVDQLEKNPIETFTQLRSCMRYTARTLDGNVMAIPDTKFIATFNPGGIGAEYCKGYWITNELRQADYEADKFYFLQARAYDNPHLDEGYLNQLRSLPPAKRKAFLDGDWDVFEGQFFPELNRDVHFIHPISTIGFDKLIAIDYGNVTVAYLISRDKFENYYVEHQFKAEDIGLDEIIMRFVSWLKEIGQWETGIRIIGDTNLFDFHKLLNMTLTPAQHFRLNGVRLEKVSKRSLEGNKDYREYSNDAIRQLLTYKANLSIITGQRMFVKRPKLYIFDDGRNADPKNLGTEYLFRQMSRLVQDPKKLGDFLEPRKQHGYDAMKMGIISFGMPVNEEKEMQDSELYKQYAQDSIY